MSLDHDQTMAAITGNDPAIRPMQLWVIKAESGRRARALRIMAKHPEPDPNPNGADAGRVMWIYREEPTQGNQIIEIVYSWIPEYNLRRLFELGKEAPGDPRYGDVVLSLPHVTLVETGPGRGTATQTLKTEAQVDRLVRDFHEALSVLEGIAHFASGTAGDEAMNFLKRAGVWSERVQRIEG